MSGERIETAGEAFDGGTAVWGTCDSCLATVVVYPHPDRGSDLPDHREWEGGFPDECPVCDEPMDWEGADPTYDVVLDRGAWQQRVAEAEARGAREAARRITEAVEGLPTTRTQALTTGWDSVSLADVLRVTAEQTGTDR